MLDSLKLLFNSPNFAFEISFRAETLDKNQLKIIVGFSNIGYCFNQNLPSNAYPHYLSEFYDKIKYNLEVRPSMSRTKLTK